MNSATVTTIQSDLIGKLVKLLPGKAPPLGGREYLGQEAVVLSAKIITTIHGEAFLSYSLRFSDGHVGYFQRERFALQ